jgi:hypothetical protein
MAIRSEPSAWRYVLCYALWAATLALGLVDAAILRTWTRELYVRSGLNRWGFAAADDLAVIAIATGALAVAIGLEYYYRGGVARGTLWRRFGVTSGVLAVVLVARFVELVLWPH